MGGLVDGEVVMVRLADVEVESGWSSLMDRDDDLACASAGDEASLTRGVGMGSSHTLSRQGVAMAS